MSVGLWIAGRKLIRGLSWFQFVGWIRLFFEGLHAHVGRWYNLGMGSQHPKVVRRHVLLLLYEHFHRDPNAVVSPEDFREELGYETEPLSSNAYYLHERGLVELMFGFGNALENIVPGVREVLQTPLYDLHASAGQCGNVPRAKESESRVCDVFEDFDVS